MHLSGVGVWNFIKQYELYGTIQRKSGSVWPSKITAEVFHILNQKMRKTTNHCCPATKVGNRQGLSTLPPHNITLSSKACLDIQRKYLLPAITRCKTSWRYYKGQESIFKLHIAMGFVTWCGQMSVLFSWNAQTPMLQEKGPTTSVTASSSAQLTN